MFLNYPEMTVFFFLLRMHKCLKRDSKCNSRDSPNKNSTMPPSAFQSLILFLIIACGLREILAVVEGIINYENCTYRAGGYGETTSCAENEVGQRESKIPT